MLDAAGWLTHKPKGDERMKEERPHAQGIEAGMTLHILFLGANSLPTNSFSCIKHL